MEKQKMNQHKIHPACDSQLQNTFVSAEDVNL